MSKSVQKTNTDSMLPSHLMQKPKIAKIDNINVFINGLEIGHSSMQGYRVSMEDAYIINSLDSIPDHTLVAILDGHAGEGCSTIASNRLCDILQETPQWLEYTELGVITSNDTPSSKESKLSKIKQALVQSYCDLDKELLESDYMDSSGSTLVCCVITPSHIICANVGDSRCIIGQSGRAASAKFAAGVVIEMSEDHKPDLPLERERISAAGGCVMFARVNGELAMSRAMGDFQYKGNNTLPPSLQMVICIPDISVHERCHADEVLILACDGVWDVINNDDAVMFISDVVLRGGSIEEDSTSTPTPTPSTSISASGSKKRPESSVNVSSEEAAGALVDLAFSMNSMDNISAVVVKLMNGGMGDEKRRRGE